MEFSVHAASGSAYMGVPTTPPQYAGGEASPYHLIGGPGDVAGAALAVTVVFTVSATTLRRLAS